MFVQAITATQYKCCQTKYLQVKQKYRRVYPVTFNVLAIEVYLLMLIHNQLIAMQK
jgi:hypothetical protein